MKQGSTHATGITLSQIIDVYVALAHNDKIVNLEPLHCSLSSRVCLSSQYAYLQSAAKEGKTLTQIADENTFASAENGGDALTYQRAEDGDQEASTEFEHKAESVPSTKAADALPAPNQAFNEDSRSDEVSSPNRASSQQSEGRSAEDSAAEPQQNNVDELRSAMPHDQEQSATSTVKGDEEDFEGEFDNSLDFCFLPSICFCSTCANILLDTAAVVSDNDNDEIPEDLFARAVPSIDESRPTGSSTGQVPKDVSQPGMESSRRDSVSSRTLETESNQLEEDLFNQNDDQLSEEEPGDSPEIQDGDVEDVELEEQDFEDAGFELDNRNGFQPDLVSAHHDLDSVDGQNDTRSEHDDELWNFGEEGKNEEGQEENQQNSLSTHQPENPPSEAPQNDEGTDAYQYDLNRLKKDSSSQTNERYSNDSDLGQITNDTLTEAADDPPSTPSGGKNGSKRKAFEDEDDFDLLDTTTPDKKRRRPS
jgi:Protein of unknown function (DUF2420)